MNVTTENKPTRSKRRPVRFLLKLFRVFILLVMVLFVAYHIADQILWRKVQQQREAFRERFGAVDFRDFIPEQPEPAEDAGRVYSYAMQLIGKVEKEHGDWSVFDALMDGPKQFDKRGSRDDDTLPTDAELDAMIEKKMVALEEMFRVLREADSMTHGVLLQFGEGAPTPVGAKATALARLMVAKVVYEARKGNIDKACQWLISSLHYTEIAQAQPTSLAQIFALLYLKLNFEALEETLNMTDALPVLGPEYLEALNRTANPNTYVWGMASELSYSWSQEWPFSRLQRSIQVLKLTELSYRIFDVVENPPSANGHEELREILDESEGLFTLAHIFTKIIVPAYVRSAESYYNIVTWRDLSNLALSLRAYKVDHGSYPDSLEALRTDYLAELPMDVYTGKPYIYEHGGDGFVLRHAALRDRSIEMTVLR